MTYPLDQVLLTTSGGFVPERPRRAPWHQPTLRRVEHAYTGNVAVVPLKFADRVQLHGLGRLSRDRDDLEPTDWMAVGWAIAP